MAKPEIKDSVILLFKEGKEDILYNLSKATDE